MRGAAYARYSTSNQTENSIAYQLSAIEDYCRAHDIDLVAVYTDQAASGTNTNRQGFQSLLAAADRREFDAVVIYDITRGSRDVGDWFSFRKAMRIRGIQVFATTQALGDISNSNDFLVELISVGMGQREVLETRQKSINGVAARAKEGVFLGGTPPLGYDVVDGEYVVNPAEARTVQPIFRMYADGFSYHDIIRALPGARGKKGRPIGKNSLYSILTNERYIGVYTWNKRHMKFMRTWAGGEPNPHCVRIKDRIPVIIDQGVWERVKRRMENNKHAKNKATRRTYLLSGLIECGVCGAAYVGHTSTNSRGASTSYYVCGNKYRTHTCKAKNINAQQIESAVMEGVRNYLTSIDFQEEAQRIAAQVNGTTPDLKAERAELAEINRKIQNGMNALLDGLRFPELEDEMDNLRLRKGELEDILHRSDCTKEQVNPQTIIDILQNALDHWDDGDRRALIEQLVPKIYTHADGSYTVNVGVHIDGCGGRI